MNPERAMTKGLNDYLVNQHRKKFDINIQPSKYEIRVLRFFLYIVNKGSNDHHNPPKKLIELPRLPVAVNKNVAVLAPVLLPMCNSEC